MKSPIAYGYGSADLPVYFNQAPVLNASGGGLGALFGGGGRGGAAGVNPNAGLGQNITPNAVPLRIQPLEADSTAPAGRGDRPAADDTAQLRQMAAQFGIAIDDTRPRVVMQFASDPSSLLLSGTLLNGQFLTNRAAALDYTLGKGHVVMFAIRPFWRWQTQGTYTLGFNTIMLTVDYTSSAQRGA